MVDQLSLANCQSARIPSGWVRNLQQCQQGVWSGEPLEGEVDVLFFDFVKGDVESAFDEFWVPRSTEIAEGSVPFIGGSSLIGS